jgi:FkbM family methyltransferase
MGARLRRWSIHGLPTLAVMAVVMALYLAPTKDDDATALVLVLGAVSLVAGRGRTTHWRALWLLWPLALLGAYAVFLDLVFPQASALPLVMRLALTAVVFWVFHHLFAGMRMGRRYLWPIFVVAAPAAVHLVYMAFDIVVWVMDQDVVYLSSVKDVPRTGRRYLSHALAPLLVATLLIGARVRPARYLPLVFMAGVVLPLLALALLDARAAYLALLGVIVLTCLVRPLRQAFVHGASVWKRRLPGFQALLVAAAMAAVLLGYASGKPRWEAMASSFSAALADVNAWGGGETRRPPFADTGYWSRSANERCVLNQARCEVDQSMYLRTAWMVHALRQLLAHPLGVGLRPDLMNFEASRAPDGIDRSQNTAGDNFLIETGLAFGFVGLGLYALFWWRILRIGVLSTAQGRRRPLFALLTVIIGMGVLRGFVDVLSQGLWYYWIAMVGILSGCAFQDSPRLRSSSTNAGTMLKRLLKRLIRGRYHGLNGLDKKMEAYLGYDGGYFVELGANDGVSQSNTLYFEKYRRWKGLLVEPAPHNYLKCRANRSPSNSIHCAACVSFGYKGEFVRIAYSNLMSTPLGLATDIADPLAHARSGKAFLGQSEDVFEYGAVARTLNDLLGEAGAPATIDFLSLDVEGAELEVLQGIDHDAYRFKFMLVECRDFERMRDYLAGVDYAFVEKLSEQDYLFRSTR